MGGKSLSEVAGAITRTSVTRAGIKKRRTRVLRDNIVKSSKPFVPAASPTERKMDMRSRIAVIDRGMIHEKILAEQIRGKVVPYVKNSMNKSFDSYIYLGPFVSQRMRLLRWASKRYANTHFYIWWIGTDVYNALNSVNGYNIGQIKTIRNATHLAVSEDLKDELASIGIDARVLVLPPITDNLYPIPLPEEYTIAVYMPSQSLDFYKYKMIKEIVSRTPDTKYIFYGNKEPLDIEGENIEVEGWVNDVDRILSKSSALLRLTMHDGFPKSIIESIYMGRFVITNHNYPKIPEVSNVDEIVDLINSRPVISDHIMSWYNMNINMSKVVKYFRGG